MNEHLVDNPNVVEMIVLDHEGQPTKLDTEGAWVYLEINMKIIKGTNVRPAWKDPTPTGDRAIIFGCTKLNGETYDGCILLEGKNVAVFRLGKLDTEPAKWHNAKSRIGVDAEVREALLTDYFNTNNGE